jgi:hypothetical protein
MFKNSGSGSQDFIFGLEHPAVPAGCWGEGDMAAVRTDESKILRTICG